MKKKFKHICCDELRVQLRRWKAERPIIIHYIFHEPARGRKRDVGNVVAFFDKVFEDAAQDVGVIKGDDPRYVVNFTHDFEYTDGTPYVEIYLEEV